MVAINDNFGDKPKYGGKSDYDGKKKYPDYQNMLKKTDGDYPRHDCTRCDKLPVAISILELKEGIMYLGSFNFTPTFVIPGYYNTTETVRPNLGIGYRMQFCGNIIELLKKMRDTPKEVHLEEKILASVFETFDFESGKPIYTTTEVGNKLADLATGGVDHIFKHPEETRLSHPDVCNFLGVEPNKIRFSSTQVCIPTDAELMAFLRQQWRKK